MKYEEWQLDEIWNNWIKTPNSISNDYEHLSHVSLGTRTLLSGYKADKSPIKYDLCKAQIHRDKHGEEGEFGWEVDHIIPEDDIPEYKKYIYMIQII